MFVTTGGIVLRTYPFKDNQFIAKKLGLLPTIFAVPEQVHSSNVICIDKPGIYRGQCSEIGGTGHGYMPVVIEALSENDFTAWVNEAKNEFAELNSRTIALSK